MKRNQFGNIRKLPSGNYQVRYKDRSGEHRTAKTIDGDGWMPYQFLIT